MKTVRIYDPPLCCSTGVCGPGVDPSLVRIAADIAYFKGLGIEITRFNLSQNPTAFLDPRIIEEMGPQAEFLPLVFLGDDIALKGRYPTRRELAEWLGVEAAAARDKPMLDLRMVGASGNDCDGGKGCC